MNVRWLFALTVAPALLVLTLPLQLALVYTLVAKDDRAMDRLVVLIQAVWGQAYSSRDEIADSRPFRRPPGRQSLLDAGRRDRPDRLRRRGRVPRKPR